MPEIILHHYPASPYAQKVRTMLAFKGLPWVSVTTPIMLPKPDLQALTGGYRKTPVLQMGADVILDSRLIARVLDRQAAEPPIFPAAEKMTCAAYTSLEPTLFSAAVSTVFQPAGLGAMLQRMGPAVMGQFAKDREALFSGGSASRPNADFGKTQFIPLAHTLDVQLADRPFLLGDTPSYADFCCYHPLWFVNSNPGVNSALAPFKNLQRWLAALGALPSTANAEMTGEAALDAALVTGRLEFDGPLLEPGNAKMGDVVDLAATDYGCDPMRGTLLHASVFEWVIARAHPTQPSASIYVHAPRQGFAVTPVA